MVKIINFLKQIKIKMKKSTKKQLVFSVAEGICSKNNKLSTKQLKLELRNQFPDENWNKYDNGQGVSELFHELVREGKFVSVYDNGTYQTYASVNYPVTNRKGAEFIPDIEEGITNLGKNIPVFRPIKNTFNMVKAIVKANVPKKSANSKLPRIGRKKALDLMKNNKGRFFTATFIKQDNTERMINCRYHSDAVSTKGNTYVKVTDEALRKTSSDYIRNVNLSTLKTLSIGGKKYRVS